MLPDRFRKKTQLSEAEGNHVRPRDSRRHRRDVEFDGGGRHRHRWRNDCRGGTRALRAARDRRDRAPRLSRADRRAHPHGAAGRRPRSSDDFLSGTRAAAAGGVTTILDFTVGSADQTIAESLDERLLDARDAVIDYAFHGEIVGCGPGASGSCTARPPAA